MVGLCLRSLKYFQFGVLKRRFSLKIVKLHSMEAPEGVDQNQIAHIATESVSLGPFQLKLPMGIGTWAWGDSSVWGYNGYDPTFNEKTMREAFSFSVKQGITLWDTAEVYGKGKSEQILGSFYDEMRNGKLEGVSPDTPLVIATKFLPFPWRISGGSLRTALLDSLNRLKVDKVQLYQIHGPSMTLRSVETWAESLAEVVKEGKVESVGVSNYNSDQVRRTHAVLAKHGIPLASNQIEFSILRNNAEHNGLLKTCKELGVSVIAYSPLAMGRLTGKYTAANPPKGNRRFSAYTMEEIDPINEKLKEIGKIHGGKTASQVALNWCICKDTIPICGVKNVQQAQENLGALTFKLSVEEVAEIDKLTKQSGWSFWQNDGR